MDKLDFGMEAFGQAEPLTRRLKNILELYPEGPSIINELIQNADDAKASTVKILLNCNQVRDAIAMVRYFMSIFYVYLSFSVSSYA